LQLSTAPEAERTSAISPNRSLRTEPTGRAAARRLWQWLRRLFGG
jgi:hypothetical protein